MRLIRIHATGPLAANKEIVLPTAASHHVTRVLRLREGASLIVFDGNGGEYQAEITSIIGSEVRVRLGEHLPDIAESLLRVTLVQGISRGERMDFTLQKSTELGVAAIVPVLTARSVVRLDDQQNHKKREHWQAIVAAACEQSGRTHIPHVAAPITLRAFCANSRKEGLRLVLNPAAPSSLAGLVSVPHRIELLIGPEGGLDDDELDLARHAGFTPVRLGPRILRTETASIVALSVLQALWGDLQ